MRRLSVPALLLLASCTLLACARRHGAGSGQGDEGGDGVEPDDLGATDSFLCPAGGTRRASNPGEWTDQDGIELVQESGGRHLLQFSYTPVAHEDMPPRETTAALQVRADSRTSVLIERTNLPEDDPCRTELQLEADMILLTNDNAFRDVFSGTLSRTAAGTRFFARVPGTPLKGTYVAPEGSEFRVEAALELSEEEDGTPRESWTGKLWLELTQGKRESTLLAAHWSLTADQ